MITELMCPITKETCYEFYGSEITGKSCMMADADGDCSIKAFFEIATISLGEELHIHINSGEVNTYEQN